LSLCPILAGQPLPVEQDGADEPGDTIGQQRACTTGMYLAVGDTLILLRKPYHAPVRTAYAASARLYPDRTHDCCRDHRYPCCRCYAAIFCLPITCPRRRRLGRNRVGEIGHRWLFSRCPKPHRLQRRRRRGSHTGRDKKYHGGHVYCRWRDHGDHKRQ